MKSMCWDTRATDSIIKSGQKDTEASIPQFSLKEDLFIILAIPHLKRRLFRGPNMQRSLLNLFNLAQ